MKPHSRAIVTLAAFLTSLPVIAIAATWGIHQLVPPATLLQDQDVSLQKRLPPEWVDAQTIKIPKVRAKHEFWGFEKANVHGTALKVLETPELRSELFPGYPDEMYQDQGLWRAYFGRDFTSTTWLTPLQSHSPYGILVFQSWLGCLDIFKRYGADGVVFGSSETFRSIIPQVLSRDAANGGKPQKILFCTTTSSYPQQAQWLAHEMSKPGMPRAKWAILGVSVWSFYQDSANFHSIQSEKKSLWERYLASQYGHYGPDFKTSEFFPALTWESLFSPNIVTLTKHRGRVRSPEEATAYFAQQPESVKTGNFRFEETQDPKKFAQRLELFTPSFPLIDGISEHECERSDGNHMLAPALEAVNQIADRTILYVPPISHRLRETLPLCYLENFAKTIAQQKSDRVNIQQDHAEIYGLTDANYLYAGDADGVVHFDANHTNFSGAQLVTRRLSKVVSGGQP